MAWAPWYLGYADQALKKSHEALTLAQERAQPFNLAYTLDHATQLPCAPSGGEGSPGAGRGADCAL